MRIFKLAQVADTRLQFTMIKKFLNDLSEEEYTRVVILNKKTDFGGVPDFVSINLIEDGSVVIIVLENIDEREIRWEMKDEKARINFLARLEGAIYNLKMGIPSQPEKYFQHKKDIAIVNEIWVREF